MIGAAGTSATVHRTVPNTGTSSDLTNFRPISIVQTNAKIVERVVQEPPPSQDTQYVYSTTSYTITKIKQNGKCQMK